MTRDTKRRRHNRRAEQLFGMGGTFQQPQGGLRSWGLREPVQISVSTAIWNAVCLAHSRPKQDVIHSCCGAATLRQDVHASRRDVRSRPGRRSAA